MMKLKIKILAGWFFSILSVMGIAIVFIYFPLKNTLKISTDLGISAIWFFWGISTISLIRFISLKTNFSIVLDKRDVRETKLSTERTLHSAYLDQIRKRSAVVFTLSLVVIYLILDLKINTY